MRDLVKKVSNPITRSYGILSLNTKLAFWYQLAKMIKEGTVVPVPANYKMTREVNIVLTALQRLDFSQQITVLRNAVVDMGVDPLA